VGEQQVKKLQRYSLIVALVVSACFAASPIWSAAETSVEVTLTDDRWGFQLFNRGSAVELSSRISIELRDNNDWRAAPVENLFLVEACSSAPVPPCVRLSSGNTLKPMPWSGNTCTSQCPVSCDLDNSLRPATYRFVITACDRSTHYYSPAFEKK
jgi:hypothetical protein